MTWVWELPHALPIPVLVKISVISFDTQPPPRPLDHQTPRTQSSGKTVPNPCARPGEGVLSSRTACRLPANPPGLSLIPTRWRPRASQCIYTFLTKSRKPMRLAPQPQRSCIRVFCVSPFFGYLFCLTELQDHPGRNAREVNVFRPWMSESVISLPSHCLARYRIRIGNRFVSEVQGHYFMVFRLLL